MAFTESKFIEGKRTCPVCGRTNDWACNVTEDGGLVYCKFVPNESGKTDSLGKYEHILKTDSKRNLPTVKQEITDNSNQVIKADAERLHAVYLALLEDLELKEIHSDDLLYWRKLSDNDIARNLYASVPDYEERHEIASNLSKHFDLEGVPGFYLGEHGWCLNMTFSGFYIPYRDEQGRIIGLQIRRDEDVENKYMWVSSRNKEKGASSGSPLHFVNPHIIRESKVVFLTEGALKADIIGSHGEIGVIASAGVGAVNPAKLHGSVFQVFPDLEKVVVAYDMDWETNENVRLALDKLLDALKERNVNVVVATWDFALGKGLDEVLVNENTPADAIEYIPAQEFQAMLASYSIEDETKVEANEVTDEVLVDEPLEKETEQNDFECVKSEPNPQEVTQEYNFDENEIMHSWGELETAEFEDAERVIYGLMRGNVGLMVASTNIGKTTLALNLALSATGRREFYP